MIHKQIKHQFYGYFNNLTQKQICAFITAAKLSMALSIHQIFEKGFLQLLCYWITDTLKLLV